MCVCGPKQCRCCCTASGGVGGIGGDGGVGGIGGGGGDGGGGVHDGSHRRRTARSEADWLQSSRTETWVEWWQDHARWRPGSRQCELAGLENTRDATLATWQPGNLAREGLPTQR